MAKVYDFKQIQKAKEAFFSNEEVKIELKPELIESWTRTKIAIPSAPIIESVPVLEETQESSILELLRVPLNRFAETIEDTGLAILLSDDKAKILGRWCSNQTILKTLDRIGTSENASLSENHVGTNGVGTIIKTKKPFLVKGTEHVADFYVDSACAGAPIWHPITGKLLGVVTLTCAVKEQSELLIPLVKSVISQCEIHLITVTDLKTTSTFNSFFNLNKVFTGPILAFGPHDMRIQNSKADKLSPSDISLIKKTISENHSGSAVSLNLSFGDAMVQLSDVEQGYPLARVIEQNKSLTKSETKQYLNSTLVPPRLIGKSTTWLNAMKEVEIQRKNSLPLLIAGEQGVGKLSIALGRPIDPSEEVPNNVLNASDVHLLGLSEWLKKIALNLNEHDVVVIRGVESLSKDGNDGLRGILKSVKKSSKVYLTYTSGDQKEILGISNFYGFPKIIIPSLRERIGDLNILWNAFSNPEQSQVSMRLSEDAVQLLQGYRWPGNLNELWNIISNLKMHNKIGLVSTQDLPSEIKQRGQLSMIDRVEADAIRQALEEASGNRQKAADILGLSRATIYRKMRAYHITEKSS